MSDDNGSAATPTGLAAKVCLPPGVLVMWDTNPRMGRTDGPAVLRSRFAFARAGFGNESAPRSSRGATRSTSKLRRSTIYSAPAARSPLLAW